MKKIAVVLVLVALSFAAYTQAQPGGAVAVAAVPR